MGVEWSKEDFWGRRDGLYVRLWSCGGGHWRVAFLQVSPPRVDVALQESFALRGAEGLAEVTIFFSKKTATLEKWILDN